MTSEQHFSLNTQPDHVHLLKHLVITTWITAISSVICLLIVITTLHWLVLRKQEQKRNVFDKVFYRQHETEPPNDIYDTHPMRNH